MLDPIPILRKFDLRAGGIVRFAPIGIGHINDTFVASFRKLGGQPVRFVLQRINQEVFTDVDALMQNLRRVTSHLGSANAGSGRPVLSLVETVDGNFYHRDPGGGCWRVFPFIGETVTYKVLSSPAQVEQLGSAFGEFSRLLADLPGPPLDEVIPDFHNSPKRYADFIANVDSDPARRAAGVAAEIGAVLECSSWATIISDAQVAGDVPPRVAHNDSKVENVLFDARTGAPVCVVDLDTVMPGSILHDFGDLVRSAVSTAPEDETDLGRLGVSLQMFEALATGFLSACGKILEPAELALLASAGKVIAYEQALRFLTDYLQGDTYYRTRYEGQNLDRARNQLHLAHALDSQQSSLETTVACIVRSHL